MIWTQYTWTWLHVFFVLHCYMHWQMVSSSPYYYVHCKVEPVQISSELAKRANRKIQMVKNKHFQKEKKKKKKTENYLKRSKIPIWVTESGARSRARSFFPRFVLIVIFSFGRFNWNTFICATKTFLILLCLPLIDDCIDEVGEW